MRKKTKTKTAPREKIKFGVIGLGHIAQVAVLPAFKNAKRDVELTALISGDDKKLKALGKKYGVKSLYKYEEFDALLDSGEIHALYIALPNTMHCEYAERALNKGIHVLCEKPLAMSEEECKRMIEASKGSGAKLMTAYRLHFDEANLKAIRAAREQLGNLRYFNSSFSFQLRDKDNIRLQKEEGGPLWDIGIYCINAARYFFRDEPTEVVAQAASSAEARFKEVPETMAVSMKFPGDRLASFVISFGAGNSGTFEVVGTKGKLQMESAYEYTTPREMLLTVGEKKKKVKFGKVDQFAPELIYFADCIRANRMPETSGHEGLADVRIIQAIEESLRQEKVVKLDPTPRPLAEKARPGLSQLIKRPAQVRAPSVVKATSPSGD